MQFNEDSASSAGGKKKALPPLPERFAEIGLVTDWDFILHLPLRYEDRTHITQICDLKDGQPALVLGRVTKWDIRQGRMRQLIVNLEDDTGTVQLRFLRFYASHSKMFAVGNDVRAYATVHADRFGNLEMVHPKVSVGGNALNPLPETFTAVYPASEHIQQKTLSKRIDRAMLDVDITELLPGEFVKENGWPTFDKALRLIHHPPVGADLESFRNRTAPAWQRIKFDELLAQQLTLMKARNRRTDALSPKLSGAANAGDSLSDSFIKALPFALTNAQKRCISEIVSDLNRTTPMNRLVQGDVGCGKTIVAAAAALHSIDSGYQAALMAPTELLAQQHFEKLSKWLTPLGVRMIWLTGSLKAKEKADAQMRIAAGDADFIVGTHALIQEAVTFSKLGLAIVDEQHRFGVEQRLKLRQSNGETEVPHLLMLSATPIPRTLAMTYLADVDVSVIDELPAGRSPVVSSLVNMNRLDEVVRSVRRAVKSGRQCYWVCPLIEESEKADLTAAQTRAQTLCEALPECRVGLVHGAMTPADKQVQMQAFIEGKLDVLVATTVIEVGVDVPNASIMIIEEAQRFGLSQLHQLRGRVGRGAVQSFCLLLYDPELSANGKARLTVIKNTSDGFEIAREDLKLRGPGEFLGERQSGVPALRFNDLEKDALLIEKARQFARQWLLEDEPKALRLAHRWFSENTRFLNA